MLAIDADYVPAPGIKQRIGTAVMSAMCQKQTFCAATADALFDHLVGAGKYCRRNCEAEGLRCLEIDH